MLSTSKALILSNFIDKFSTKLRIKINDLQKAPAISAEGMSDNKPSGPLQGYNEKPHSIFSFLSL